MWGVLLATSLAATTQAGQPISAASSRDSVEIAALSAELEARSEASHPGKGRVLYSAGRNGAFAGYVMGCLNKIVLDSAPNPGALRALRPDSSLLFSIAILPDGTVKSVEILMNHGGPAIEARLRSAIRRAAPFAPFPAEMAKKYSEVVVTHTLQSAACTSSSPDCQ
ncbi:hypothetical protein [Rhodanobacter sp. C05]|uniref:hypothetical protein n=1 Tax=Rhodanobacter sp. C05 TaxID=1945855 RepID=UPI00117A5E26|nr:hypothetical protein [Rhodanobacter sp. C05]